MPNKLPWSCRKCDARAPTDGYSTLDTDDVLRGIIASYRQGWGTLRGAWYCPKCITEMKDVQRTRVCYFDLTPHQRGEAQRLGLQVPDGIVPSDTLLPSATPRAPLSPTVDEREEGAKIWREAFLVEDRHAVLRAQVKRLRREAAAEGTDEDADEEVT
jgi:rubredoxin